METTTLVIVFALVWVLVGLAAYWWLARRGHRSQWWLLVAALLGPFFAAAAQDRAEREPRTLEHWPSADETQAGRPRILVGVDGSVESERALRSVLDWLPDDVGTLLLVSVVDFDAEAEADTDTRLAQAYQRLDEAVGWSGSREVSREVVAGAPADTLLRRAADRQADLIVVGRRGRGMSTRLLGSVAVSVVRRSALPVLIGPTAMPGRDTPTTDAPTIDAQRGTET